MNKERLKEIKGARKTILEEESFQKKCIFLYSFDELGYLDWLIEQAERVQELEQQNKRYREALEFYADMENYEPEHYDPDTHDYTSIIDHDKGATARKALEGEK